MRRTAPPPVDEPPLPAKPQLSIREQIALKRAEAKKAQTPADNTNGGLDDFSGFEDALPTSGKKQGDEEVDLGRWSVKETIERARSTGSLNLVARALPCIPSALYEIHLGITPEPLKSVPEEPSITTSTADDISATTRRRGNRSDAPSWYEAQDLQVLKAWSNEIVEIQPEISMFGSLKTVDLHSNKLGSLPDAFADLTALTVLDLSHNALTSLPADLFALPHLTTLNISHNRLTFLPFRAPFDVAGSTPLGRTKDSRGDWFSKSITRATAPLPRLTSLDVSYNGLSASAIDHEYSQAKPSLPTQVTKLDISGNPLGNCVSLLQSLARLERLRELRLQRAEIGNDSFPIDIISSLKVTTPFPSLRLLDMEETHVTKPAVEAALRPPALRQAIEFEVTTEEPREGVLCVVVGKRVVKEAWEVEAERRAKLRSARVADSAMEEGIDFGSRAGGKGGHAATKVLVAKEAWEMEAEQGLLTEGAKRRARAAAAAAQSSALSAAPASTQLRPTSPLKKPAVAAKEAWEIEAEQGLLTEGAKRRARAAAAVTAAINKPAPQASPAALAQVSPSESPSPPSLSSVLSNPQFYNATTCTLTLPLSAPPPKAPHARSFSHVPTSKAVPKGKVSTTSDLALAIPTPTLPLSVIAVQPFAQTLKILNLSKRRKDPLFSLPPQDGVFLPVLEELTLEGCNISDTVPVTRSGATPDGGDGFSMPRTSEPLLPLLAKLFPSLRMLDVSYNALTSAALSQDALSSIILASDSAAPERKGLRHLRLRGNHIDELDGFQGIAELFKGNRECPAWNLEELDLRDNEIGKLPAELGLLPLDVFLVDGNIFRIPQRRVWEREGTKGLLSWLRGRIE